DASQNDALTQGSWPATTGLPNSLLEMAVIDVATLLFQVTISRVGPAATGALVRLARVSHAGSTRVFSRTSHRQFGHSAAVPKRNPSRSDLKPVTRSRMLSNGISEPSGLQCTEDSIGFSVSALCELSYKFLK